MDEKPDFPEKKCNFLYYFLNQTYVRINRLLPGIAEAPPFPASDWSPFSAKRLSISIWAWILRASMA